MIRPKIILVIASSIDGRIAFPGGGATHLGSSIDKRILNDALSEVDATLFGSGTLKSHKCNFLVKEYNKLGDLEISKKQPISIVAGNPSKFSYSWHFFNQPLTRWLLNSNPHNIKANKNFDKQFNFNNNWNYILGLFKKEGIENIALLGGAKLIHSFSLENLIDEIKITITPKIIGGEYTWIPVNEKIEVFNTKQRWKINAVKQLKTNEISFLPAGK